VGNGEEQHGIGELSVEPDVLIEGNKLDLGADPSHDSPAHWQEDEHSIEGQNQTGTT
jgi:hypothetical protein